MGQQNGKLVRRSLFSHLLDVVDTKEVSVVDPSQVNAISASGDGQALVQQHPDAEIFEPRHYTDCVVVAEHAVDRRLQTRPNPRQAIEGRSKRSPCLAPIVTGQDAQIVIQRLSKLD